MYSKIATAGALRPSQRSDNSSTKAIDLVATRAPCQRIAASSSPTIESAPTNRQNPALGLEAQRQAVQQYLKPRKWSPVGEFTEIESGKRNKRPELEKALAVCKRKKAKLVIAKLDRLSRNLAFIATLMDSREFVAVDNPHANKLTVHILAAVAQHEREMIAQVTQGCAESRQSPRCCARESAACRCPDRAVANLKADADRFAKNVAPIIREIQSSGVASNRGIARSTQCSRCCDGSRW
jgi:DNA invertase Pin-like site-specific DNA recombinase